MSFFTDLLKDAAEVEYKGKRMTLTDAEQLQAESKARWIAVYGASVAAQSVTYAGVPTATEMIDIVTVAKAIADLSEEAQCSIG